MSLNLIKKFVPFYKEYIRTCNPGLAISYFKYFCYKLGLLNRKTYWPRPKTCWVGMPKRLYVGKNSVIGRAYGFYQAFGGIYIGNYVQFATHVSLLTSNHDIYNQYISHHKPIIIGDYCWLAMNTSILPGVELGPRTIVATGAVVNKSFPEGYCILGGVPAKVVKRLDPTQFNPENYIREMENYGFIPAEKFEKDPREMLNKYLDSNFFEIKEGQIVLKSQD